MIDLWNDQRGTFHPDSALDYLPEPQLRRLQLQRLQAIVKRAYDHVELTRTRMQTAGITPDDIRSLEDIRLLPFSTKTDLRDTYPYGLFASPISEVVRLHASSGTTGKPIVVGYTQQDMEVWKNVMKRTFVAAGLSRRDIIQNAFGYGLFTGGLGAHYGAEALGATVIPASGGNTTRQLMVLQDFGVTAICSTPSYFVHLVEVAERMGIDFHKLPLRTGIFGAEPWTPQMRSYIQEKTNIKAYDIYGLSEIIGPGVATECSEQHGLHVFEDHFLVEVVHPVTGEPLPDGCEGELVLTTLSKEAMPILRYRTHDLTSIISKKCSCGRTIRRIDRIGKRTDDMFIIRGVNIFPGQIEAALLSTERNLPHYQIVLTRAGGLDQMEVRVEVTQSLFSDTIKAMEQLQERFTKAIENVIGIRVKVTLVEPHSIPRSEGKAKRVIDQRN
ncbi:MAG TPA: phenylacetate--CoA ligase [Firmicutes bacterium]|jgi:phenylacetate-CoA ligase|nr:phenylacetate--CoA ligase [Bacillota bacterium]